MDLKLFESYKSLEPFQFLDLPDFTIVTGKNGSGKSQLLELIKAKHDQRLHIKFEVDAKPQKIRTGNASISVGTVVDSSSYNAKIHNFYITHTNHLHLWHVLDEILHQDITFSISKYGVGELIKILNKLSSPILRTAINKAHILNHNEKTTKSEIVTLLCNDMKNNRFDLDIAIGVARRANKSISQLRESDFRLFPPDEISLGRQDLFNHSIEMLFYSYAKRRNINYNLFVANEYLGKSYTCCSDKEFTSRWPAPWDLLNSIFQQNNFHYYFEGIDPVDLIEGDKIEFRLKNTHLNKYVNFSNLSTGEQVIMALIASLFVAAFYSDDVDRPELVIMDEPDSPLHPEMCQLFLNVVNETFVKKLGLKVIITTHSPSTVALAPESSLFELKNGTPTTLDKVTKDEALNILTLGVPTISIDYKNHKQIFVESPDDAAYYQMISQALKKANRQTYTPYFISTGKGSGSKSQVLTLVNQLRSSGNKKVSGIVDWDNQKSFQDGVMVHGDELFYSLENIVFSPIFLAIYFCKNHSERFREDMNIENSNDYYRIGIEKSNEELQKYADWVTHKISQKFKTLSTTEKIRVEFANDRHYTVPKWFMEMQGHQLEEKLKSVFPSLKKNHDQSLILTMINIIAICYPFVPRETVRIIESITK